MLRLHVLASGSKGNASIVEDAHTGRGVLIDCGICKRDFLAACAEVGFDPANLAAVFVTHEHTDHTKGMGVVLRGLAKKGIEGVPLYVAPSVLRASKDLQAVEGLVDVRSMKAGDDVTIPGASDFAVHVFATSHDAAASFGFRIGAAADSVGFMTDTGIVTGEAHEALQHCRILAIEGNHDVRMLENGPYPYALRKRVASDVGHLSNDQAAEELGALLHDGLEHVVAMHVSENNNTYDLPVAAMRDVVERAGCPVSVQSAFQHRVASIG